MIYNPENYEQVRRWANSKNTAVIFGKLSSHLFEVYNNPRCVYDENRFQKDLISLSKSEIIVLIEVLQDEVNYCEKELASSIKYAKSIGEDPNDYGADLFLTGTEIFTASSCIAKKYLQSEV